MMTQGTRVVCCPIHHWKKKPHAAWFGFLALELLVLPSFPLPQAVQIQPPVYKYIVIVIHSLYGMETLHCSVRILAQINRLPIRFIEMRQFKVRCHFMHHQTLIRIHLRQIQPVQSIRIMVQSSLLPFYKLLLTHGYWWMPPIPFQAWAKRSSLVVSSKLSGWIHQGYWIQALVVVVAAAAVVAVVVVVSVSPHK